MAIGIGILIAVALGACGEGGDASERPASYSGPLIEFDRTVYDFGECFLGRKKSHTFTLTNNGSETLEINDVKRECGCLTPEFSTKVILPGATATMKVVFSPPVIGAISKRLRIYSNDEFARETVITLKALSLGSAHLQPAVLTVDDAVPPLGITKDLTLRVDAEEVITAVGFITDCHWLRFEQAAGLNQNEVAITLTIAPPPGPGRVFEKVIVDISTKDSKGQSRRFALPLPFQVIGELRPELAAMPDVVHLGVVAADRETVREVIIKGQDRQLGEATLRTSGTSELTADLNGEILRVHVAAGQQGRVAGQVTLRWTDGSELAIPVFGARR
jgi:hypothetical protein